MPARASFSLEDGMRTVSCIATLPLRMRVSMSAIGSVIVIGSPPHPLALVPAAAPPSPAGLRHARDFPGMDHLAKADPAQPELAVDRARPTAAPAAGVGPHPE